MLLCATSLSKIWCLLIYKTDFMGFCVINYLLLWNNFLVFVTSCWHSLGSTYRQVGVHSVNDHSSRSHSMLTVYVDSEEVTNAWEVVSLMHMLLTGPTCCSNNVECIETCSWMLDDVWWEKMCLITFNRCQIFHPAFSEVFEWS